MTFEPLIPSSLWLALALGGVALWIWYARRRPGGISRRRWMGSIGLMGAGIIAALVVLLNPTWVRPIPPPAGKPLLTILVDESASMATPDVQGAATRYQGASNLATSVAKKLEGEFEVRVKGFAGGISARTVGELGGRKPDGMATNLAGAVGGSLEEERPAGQAILLLSDGIHNSGGTISDVLDAVRLARANGAPVFTRTFGGEGQGWDLAVELRASQDLSFVKQKVPLTVRVKYQGLAAVKTNVLLLQDGKEVARREASVLPNVPLDVHFQVSQEKVGLYSYEVKAEPLAGEASQANNSASYLLRVVDEPIRVLVLEGKPYWDSKFLLRTLTADQALALDSVVRFSDQRLLQRTMALPQKGSAAVETRAETEKILTDARDVLEGADRLKGYQIVLLGRDAEVFLTDEAVANLQKWISQDGGSLVCYRGPPTAKMNEKLSRLMPVKWSGAVGRETSFRVKLTAQGQDLLPSGTSASGEILPRMPSLSRSMEVDGSKPLAVVLATAVGATGEERPAVVYQPYGAGKVVVLEGAGMWRWAFLPPNYQQQEEVYSALWHSLLRWLVSGANLLPGQRMTLRSDKVTFNADEAATATLLIKEEAGKEIPKVELVAAGAKEATAFAPAAIGEEPGSFRVNFGKLAEGRYEARVAGAKEDEPSLKAVFDVRVFGEEQLNLAARPDLMARIAADSGGAVFGNAGADEVVKKFREHVGKAVSQKVERTSAWDRWWVLLSIVGLWTVTWAVRRSGGLV